MTTLVFSGPPWSPGVRTTITGDATQVTPPTALSISSFVKGQSYALLLSRHQDIRELPPSR